MLKLLSFLIFCAAVFADVSVSLNKIAILKYGDELPSLEFEDSVWIDPYLNLSCGEKLLYQRLSCYLGNNIKQDDLKGIEQIVLEVFQERHRPIVSVVIPPQNLSSKVLQVLVVEPTISSVCVGGNRWTSDAFILKGSGICQGVTLDSYELQQNLAWLNRSPFRRTDIVLTPGDKPATTKAELITKERFPLRVYAGADNTGTVYLRHTRIYSGFNAGYLWGLDHQASFQWTTAPNPHTLTAFSGQYLVPLPWHDQLLFYGGYSKFKGDIPVELMSQAGKAWQASGRYQMIVSPIFGNLLQQISFGYDFKRTNSELLFGGLFFQGGFADINQFSLSYTLDYSTCDSKTSFIGEIFGAPFQMTHDQNNDAYQSLRPFAKSKYAYGRVRLSHSRNLFRGYSLRMVFAGQLTGWNLLASEQFPLGGYETVRGYEERAFNADSGVLASAEFVSPNWGMFSKDVLEVLAFFDFGWGNLHKPFTGQKKSEWLAGVGPAIRYRYSSNIVLRGDIGFPLHKTGLPRHGTHYYGGATVSY